MSDIVADVEAGIDFLAGIEDVFWVEYVFGGFEDFQHLFGVHKVQVRRADDAIVVFAADVALELYGRGVEGLGHFFYQGRCSLVGEIKERVEVEVTIATVPVDR